MSYFNAPIPAESNPLITPQYYQPNVFTIANLTYSEDTVLVEVNTTSYGATCNYVIGQDVRFIIPFPYGAVQLDEVSGYVIATPGTNQVIVQLKSGNTLNFNPFIPSPSFIATPAQILAIGDVNSGQINTGPSGQPTFVPGSFINISPG